MAVHRNTWGLHDLHPMSLLVWNSGFKGLVSNENGRDLRVLDHMLSDGIELEIHELSSWQKHSRLLGFVSNVDW